MSRRSRRRRHVYRLRARRRPARGRRRRAARLPQAGEHHPRTGARRRRGAPRAAPQGGCGPGVGRTRRARGPRSPSMRSCSEGAHGSRWSSRKASATRWCSAGAGCRTPTTTSTPSRYRSSPTHMVFEAAARVAADGRVLARPGAEEIGALAAGIRAVDAETVVVVVVNAYAHPAPRDRAGRGPLRSPARGAGHRTPHSSGPRSGSSSAPRSCVLNGFVHPMMDRYYANLAARIADTGIAAPIHIATSNGGTVSIATARRRPVDTLLSGPASGVVAASRISGIAAEPRIVSLDMGGTSSDLCGHPGRRAGVHDGNAHRPPSARRAGRQRARHRCGWRIDHLD